MRVKKTLTTTLMALVVIMSLWSCSNKREGNDGPNGGTLSISTEEVNFLATASQQNITVKGNVSDWTATVQSDAKSWLSARPSASALVISASENDNLSSRVGKITVSGSGSNKVITVTQMGVKPEIITSESTFTVSADGGNVSLDVSTNVKYELTISGGEGWLKLLPQTRAIDIVKSVHTFQVAWSKETKERTAEVVIKQKDGDLVVKVPIIQSARGGYDGHSDGDIKDDVKVPVSNATASSHQPGEGIELSYDGKMNTIYHSNWNNSGSDYFPITLQYFFSNQDRIDYLIYYPRTDSSNGNFKEVEIWVKTAMQSAETKLMDYDFKGSGTATRIDFKKPIEKPEYVKFVVKSGAGDKIGFAACAEMEFYKKNPDNFDALSIFTDITCTKLRSDVTAEKVDKIDNTLYKNIAFHMLNATYPREFRIDEFKAYPHPDAFKKENKTNPMSLLDNPTGISVTEGEELIVFVGETYGQKIALQLQDLDKPNGDGFLNGGTFPLVTGVNKLKMTGKGLLYVMYHTSNYQTAKPIQIHFATGRVNGYFDNQKHKASDWSKYLNGAVDKYFDVIGKYAHITFPTQDFRNNASTTGPELIANYDELVRLELEFMGMMKQNRPMVNRAYFNAMYHSYMYATSYHTAYNINDNGVRALVTTPKLLKKECWGPAHELGHMFQTRPGFLWQGMTEVSNNLHSLYVQTEWENSSRIETEDMGRYNNRYEKAYNNSFVRGVSYVEEGDVFCKLVPLWQINLYFAKARGYEVYKDFYELLRTSPDERANGILQLEFVLKMCDLTKTNLLSFFEKWGFLKDVDVEIEDYDKEWVTITKQMAEEYRTTIKNRNYPTLTDKMEYICDANYEVFKNKLPVSSGSASKTGKKLTMTGWKNVVAYEVYEGDNLVFVSNKSSFTLDSEPTAKTKVYAISYNGNKTEVKF